MTESRVHVALLTTTLDVSGAERVVAALADGLIQADYRVSVVALQRRSGALTRLVRNPNVSMLDLGVRGAWDVGAIGRLRRWLLAERVSVLYTFLFHAHLLGRCAGRLAGVPHILSSQQVANWGGSGRRALERLTAHWCERIVAVSDGVRIDLIQRMHVPADRVRVIFNAVDVDAYHSRTRPFEQPRPAGQVVFGSASRLAPEKDHASLLQGFAMAVRNRPDLRLRLAGDGPLEARLRREVQTLGLQRHVEMLGQIADVASFYDSLDVYVQPSRTEGLPCAVVEAMAMSRPVVATDVAGNRDAVVPGVTGLLIPAGSPQAWAAALTSIAGDVAYAQRLGAAGRQRAVEMFDAKAMIASTLCMLEELLKPSVRSSCRAPD
jgi:glycosyltransferase involved in cell wall biosynthesis